MTIYADYSASQLSGSALAAAGFGGTIRYAGTVGHGKNTTPSECASIRAAGLDLHAVFELGTQDYLGGFTAGVTNAQALLNDANNCGISGVLFMSADGHLLSGTEGTWQQYLNGAQTVLGTRTGAYGFSEAMTAAQSIGVKWFWQAGSTPAATGTAGFVNVWQRNAGQTTTSVAGITCDINDVLIPLSGTVEDMTPDEHNALMGIASQINGPWQSFVPGSTVKMSLVDFVRALDARTFSDDPVIKQLAADVTAIKAQVTTEEADLLAAIKGVVTGQVDVNALAAALSPLLSTVQIKALAAQLSK